MHAWEHGEDLDLGRLLQAIQQPPVARVGVMDLESFYPAKERFELAMALHNLLAAPAFQGWLEGTPLDVGQMLYGPSGKPRVAIFSIAHLGDAERIFFVSLLLEQAIAWMRAQPGTGSLRALLYMDEIYGYFPPTANPPSKGPLLTLVKQARAFGLGVVLATQNPVDLDSKALANCGTWFVGKLQTERDRARLLDGLQGAGGALDRGRLETLLGQLGNRVFLLHDVHAGAPVVMQTRWALTYLRGPMTREEIKRLARSAGSAAAGAEAAGESGPVAAVPSGPTAMPPAPAAPPASAAPVLPPDVPQVFLAPRGIQPAGTALVFVPMLLGVAAVRFADAKAGIAAQREVAVLASLPATPGAAAWLDGGSAPAEAAASSAPPSGGASFAPLSPEAGQARSYARWKRELVDWLYRGQTLEVFRCERVRAVSRPGETERDFRIRLRDLWREQRDTRAEALRAKYAPKLERLQEQLRRAEQAEREKAMSAISFGATLLGAFVGGGRRSTIGRATTAARGVGRAQKEARDVERAGENREAVQARLQALAAEFHREIEGQDAGFDTEREPLSTVAVRPKKADVAVLAVSLAWVPSWQDTSGKPQPALE